MEAASEECRSAVLPCFSNPRPTSSGLMSRLMPQALYGPPHTLLSDILEVLIGMAEYGDVNFILGKALRVLPETKLSKPVRNVLQKAPRFLVHSSDRQFGEFILFRESMAASLRRARTSSRVKTRNIRS